MKYWLTVIKWLAVAIVCLIAYSVVMAAITILTYVLAFVAIIWIGWEIYKYWNSNEST